MRSNKTKRNKIKKRNITIRNKSRKINKTRKGTQQLPFFAFWFRIIAEKQEKSCSKEYIKTKLFDYK
jgi:hypothetical protein